MPTQRLAEMCTTEWGVELPGRGNAKDMWLKVIREAGHTVVIPHELEREVCCACYLQKATGAYHARRRFRQPWPLEPAERARAQAFRDCALAHHGNLHAAHTA